MSVGGGTPGILFRSVVSGSSYLCLLHLPLLRHFVHLRVWALLIYESSEMYEYNTHTFSPMSPSTHTRELSRPAIGLNISAYTIRKET
jgi:hypothetical protein